MQKNIIGVNSLSLSIPGRRVTAFIDQQAIMHGYPGSIRVDNGPEFTGKHFQQWAQQRGIHIDYIEPGKPTDNAFIESFNGKFRDECFNENWFLNLKHAREVIEIWRIEYNEVRRPARWMTKRLMNLSMNINLCYRSKDSI